MEITKISKISLYISLIIFGILACLFMYWLNHNNMDMCMGQYKDYNYCKSIIEEGNSNE